MSILNFFKYRKLNKLPNNLIQRVLRLGIHEPSHSNNWQPEKVSVQGITDPQEVLHLLRVGVSAHYHCPIANLVRPNGWQFGDANWNPFSTVAKKLLGDPNNKYMNSALERYYSYHQPRNAAQAVVGLEQTACQLTKLEPLMVYLVPWESSSVTELRSELIKVFRADLKQHCGPQNLSIEKHGWKDHGSVSPIFGEFEFQRIRNIILSVKSKGYIQDGSGVRVWVLQRGNEYRFLIRGGMHRAAVADAMGLEFLSVSFIRPWVINCDEVIYWSGVKQGIWKKTEALRYFNHLFDFDSQGWADQANLL